MNKIVTLFSAFVIALLFAAPASAKTPPPVSISVATTCLVSGLLDSDYRATATLTGTVSAVDVYSENKGLLASNVALPGTVNYFSPVGVKTDNVFVTAVGSTKELASINVHTPCVKAPQGQA